LAARQVEEAGPSGAVGGEELGLEFIAAADPGVETAASLAGLDDQIVSGGETDADLVSAVSQNQPVRVE